MVISFNVNLNDFVLEGDFSFSLGIHHIASSAPIAITSLKEPASNRSEGSAVVFFTNDMI